MTFPNRSVSIAALVFAFAVPAVIAPATAAIRCDGTFQANSQGEFESLYCKEDNLARVARSHGIQVTADQIRRSWSLEGDVCRQIGIDISVGNICDQFNNRNNHHCMFNMPC